MHIFNVFKIFKVIKRHSLFNNAFYLIINNLSTSLLGFIFWNVMAKFYTISSVGIGSSLVSASGFLATLANLGLGAGIIRFIPEMERKNMLINVSYTVSSIAAIMVCIVYFIGMNYWAPDLLFIRKNFVYLSTFIVFTVATIVSILIDQTLIAGRQAKFILCKNFFISILKIAFTLLFFLQLGGYGIFVGTGLSFLIGTLVTIYFILPLIYVGYLPRVRVDKYILKKIMRFSFSNYLANILNNAPQYIFPLMVLYVLGPEASAYMYIAWMISMVLAIIPVGIGDSFFSESSHKPNEIDWNGSRGLIIALILSILACCIMVVLGKWVLYIFGKEYMYNSTKLLQILAIAVIPQCINVFYLKVNQIKKRIKLIIVQTSAYSLLTLGLSYFLLSKMGLIGVGIGYVSAHTIIAIFVICPLMSEIVNVK